MDEQKKTSGSLALNSTPRVITIAPSTPVRDRKLRVAAYARVSSSSEDQLNSFAAQNAHYTAVSYTHLDVYKRQECSLCMSGTAIMTNANWHTFAMRI